MGDNDDATAVPPPPSSTTEARGEASGDAASGGGSSRGETPVFQDPVAFFLPDLSGGGPERVAVSLANGLAARGTPITLLVMREEGPFLGRVDARVPVVDLGVRRATLTPFAIRRALRQLKPALLVCHMTHANTAGLLGARFAGLAHRTIVVEHNQFDRTFALQSSRVVRAAFRLARRVYPWAGAVVSVAEGVQKTLERVTALKHPRMRVIHNPIVDDALLAQAAEAPDHAWLAARQETPRPPTLSAVGALIQQKDYVTFLDMMARLRERHPDIRAVVHGEGPLRPVLEAYRKVLALDEAVDFAGFTGNPYAAMRAADAFVLTSRWEGLPTVVIEALAAGANVVSTDCPSGPDEILGGGAYGRLAPVGDPATLAEAVSAALAEPADPDAARRRSLDFTVDRAVDAYTALFHEVAAANG